MGENAREAARKLSGATPADKNRALEVVAQKLRSSADRLKEENRKDLVAGEKAGLTSAMLDRLELSDKVILIMLVHLLHIILYLLVMIALLLFVAFLILHSYYELILPAKTPLFHQ